ncbi:MAG TPA: phosphatase PAP2 family protein [Candidatus Dormibacteraeota bacterium]
MDQAGRPLIAAGALLLAAFAALTLAVLTGLPLGPDLAVERAVQAVPWGPLAAPFGVVDYLEGLRQVGVAVAVIAVTFLFNRRATLWALACSLSAGAFQVLELAVHRPRPPASLVHVIRHAPTFSYPSGHTIFVTWAATVLVVAVVAVRWRRWTPLAAGLAVLVLAVVVVGRIYEGEHWPSDCLAGLLLGGGWTLLTLGLPRIGRPVLTIAAEARFRPARRPT